MTSPLLSRMDLRLTDVVADAAIELLRAGDDRERLAAWAAKWGEPAIRRLRETSSTFSQGQADGHSSAPIL